MVLPPFLSVDFGQKKAYPYSIEKKAHAGTGVEICRCPRYVLDAWTYPCQETGPGNVNQFGGSVSTCEHARPLVVYQHLGGFAILGRLYLFPV